jgi:glycosyltransferase involved in cell wall biosynthesis
MEPGGAERIAVNYANALSEKIDFSGLVATRKEGPLSSQISNKVSYFFLNKKSSLNLKAVFRLRKLVIQNKVEIVHAHSTSFFTAFLLKITLPSIQLIWHDHYGDSDFLSKRPFLSLRLTIPFFNGIIAVNKNLNVWAKQQLHFVNSIYLPNFPTKEKEVKEFTVLEGMHGKRILCLANLRPQKNHFLLLEVAKRVKVTYPEWSFHLIGKDLGDAYSQQIRNKILELHLEDTVFLYGSKQDIQNIMKQSTIGILTSKSEGLPVALLEYGWYSKPVVVTNVGEISSLVKNVESGFVVGSSNEIMFYEALIQLIENNYLRNDFGMSLHNTIMEQYSEEVVMKHYLNWLAISCK